MVMCSKLKSHPFCFGIGRRVFNVSCTALPVERQVVPFELIFFAKSKLAVDAGDESEASDAD